MSSKMLVFVHDIVIRIANAKAFCPFPFSNSGKQTRCWNVGSRFAACMEKRDPSNAIVVIRLSDFEMVCSVILTWFTIKNDPTFARIVTQLSKRKRIFQNMYQLYIRSRRPHLPLGDHNPPEKYGNLLQPGVIYTYMAS